MKANPTTHNKKSCFILTYNPLPIDTSALLNREAAFFDHDSSLIHANRPNRLWNKEELAVFWWRCNLSNDCLSPAHLTDEAIHFYTGFSDIPTAIPATAGKVGTNRVLHLPVIRWLELSVPWNKHQGYLSVRRTLNCLTFYMQVWIQKF